MLLCYVRYVPQYASFASLDTLVGFLYLSFSSASENTLFLFSSYYLFLLS